MRKSFEKQIATLGWIFHVTGALALASLLCGYTWMVILPIGERKQLCEQRITQLESMLAKASRVRSEHQTLEGELASLKQSVEETQRRLPAELREHEFVEQVRTAAGKTGMEVSDYQMGVVEEMASYSKAQLTFQCQGSFASICHFLDEIDHLARITEISNLQIEPAENLRDYPLQVTFVLYFGGSTHDRSRRGEVL